MSLTLCAATGRPLSGIPACLPLFPMRPELPPVEGPTRFSDGLTFLRGNHLCTVSEALVTSCGAAWARQLASEAIARNAKSWRGAEPLHARLQIGADGHSVVETVKPAWSLEQAGEQQVC